MFSRRLVVHGAMLAFCSAAVVGQQKSTAPSSLVLREFPVVLQQSVEAGKTPVGTQVRGRLATATLFHGTLIPRNAVFSGVIFESAAKTTKSPARLGIRMQTAQWKHGSTCMKAYLMPLYYTAAESVEGPPPESPDPSSRTLQGADSQSPMNQHFPSDSSEAVQGAIPNIPTLSSRPVRMKNVALEPAADGGVTLMSEHDNIKLYKMTTYVLAAVEPPTK